jgi:hypothetical protein
MVSRLWRGLLGGDYADRSRVCPSGGTNGGRDASEHAPGDKDSRCELCYHPLIRLIG